VRRHGEDVVIAALPPIPAPVDPDRMADAAEATAVRLDPAVAGVATTLWALSGIVRELGPAAQARAATPPLAEQVDGLPPEQQAVLAAALAAAAHRLAETAQALGPAWEPMDDAAVAVRRLTAAADALTDHARTLTEATR
jgi:hypothetical protein